MMLKAKTLIKDLSTLGFTCLFMLTLCGTSTGKGLYGGRLYDLSDRLFQIHLLNQTNASEHLAPSGNDDAPVLADVTDDTIPTVTLVSPADQSVVNHTMVTFNCSATDDFGLLEATLYIGDAPETATFSGPTETNDAQITADQPNTNDGHGTSINVDGHNPHAHAVIKFANVFGDDPDQVPLGSSIVQATLEINCYNSGHTMELYRLTEEWVESEVTWNECASGAPWTSPGADGPFSNAGVALNGDCTATGLRSIDITPFVQEWSNGAPNDGILFTDTGTDGVDFHSSESPNPPVLTVVYQPSWEAVETQPLSGTSDTAIFTTSLADQQHYSWNCVVANTSGGESWPPADFQLTVNTSAPDKPLLVAPVSGAIGESTSPTLEVVVSDPDGDLLEVTFYGRTALAGEQFTIIALPDTQYYSESYPHIFTAQTQWIASEVADRNVAFVTHEGDLVQHWDNTTEWKRANTSMSLLDGIVPYGMAPGNHDQPTTFFNQYFPFERYENESWYGGHHADKNDNSFQLFSAGGLDFIIFHLEFCPLNEIIVWANTVLNSYPSRIGIITTHGFIDGTGNRNVHGCGSTQYIWDELVVPNDNVYFVLCGHVHDEYTRTDDVDGREVHQFLADYQGRPSGGNGWLRIMRFSPAEDTIYIETYSPYLDQFETDADSQFSLEFPMNEFLVIATLTAIPSGSNNSVVWPDLLPNTEYKWFVEVRDREGNTQVGPMWQFATGSGLPCEADFDHDSDVDGADLALFAADFGRTDCSGDCNGDFEPDSDVDGSDLAWLAADFGRTDCADPEQ